MKTETLQNWSYRYENVNNEYQEGIPNIFKHILFKIITKYFNII